MLCKKIVARIGNKPNIVAAYKRSSWCAVQAMNEAISPIYVYRGQKVTWKAPADKGDLEIGDEIWKPDASGNYPQVVTVAGGSRIYTLASTKILFNLYKDLDADLAKDAQAKGKKMYKKTLAVYRKLLKQIARKQRKLAGRNKVIFAEQRFYTTVAVAPVKGPIDCDKLYYLAYAPSKAHRQGYMESVEVNGTPCQEYPFKAGEVDRNDIIGLSCGRYLKPGNNKVSVGVYNSIHTFNYSRREWRRTLSMNYQLKNVQYTATKRGKRLYAQEITCIKK